MTTIEQWRIDAEDTGHGMVLVALNTYLDYLATCHCGWFADKPSVKPDLAAFKWRQHMEEI